MVVFINGSLGVGKTSVAQYLLWNRPQSVLLEGDSLCNLHPFDPYDAARIATLIEIICFMVAQYRNIGYRIFIVDCIFEQVSEIEAVTRKLQDLGEEVFHYLLWCEQPQRERQILARKRDNHLWERERSAELHTRLLATFSASPLIKTVDTTGKTVANTGDFLLHDLCKPSP